jgi:hypothetical protein
MIWTPEKSRKQERSEELRKICIKYNKILSIIKSCTDIHHINVCYRIINNFEQYCNFKKLPQQKLYFYLKNYLKIKKINIRLS